MENQNTPGEEVNQLDRLDANLHASILKCLTPQEVVSASLVCKQLQQAAEARVVWQHLYDTALCPRVKERLLPPPSQISNWRSTVIRGILLGGLRFGAWEKLQTDGGRGVGVRPCPREGHAATSWGVDSMILFGGWGSGIRNDLYILERTPLPPPAAAAAAPTAAAAAAAAPTATAAAAAEEAGGAAGAAGQAGRRCPAGAMAAAAAREHAAAAAAAGPGPSAATRGCLGGFAGPGPSAPTALGPGATAAAAGACAGAGAGAGGSGSALWLGPEDAPCGWRWRVPRVAGRRPAIRYGHSVTRCGAAGELLAVYGGMQAGGYTAEITSLAILRPYTGTLLAPEGDPGDYEYEWWTPELSGADPGARGYHSACASEDGTRLFVFGGIARRDSTTRLAVIDLATGHVERPATTGAQPSPRFGCSLFCYGGKLWVVGGGNGSDLARSGHDLFDVLTLDLKTLEWSEVETANQPHDKNALGRCHASCLVGSKLVMFGGSLELGNGITWLDVGAEPQPVWGHPAAVLGLPPGKRMSAVVALSRTDMVFFGGWIYSSGEMGDLYRFRLLLDDRELLRAKDMLASATTATTAATAGAAAGAAGGEAGPSGRGGGGGGGGGRGPPRAGPVTDASVQLSELLSAKIARYYTLMREAQERESGGQHVPLALVRQMHETMMAIRLLRAHAQQEGMEGVAEGWSDDDDDDDEDEEEEAEEAEEADGRGGRAAALGGGGDDAEAEGGDPFMVELEYDTDETGEEETEESEEESEEEEGGEQEHGEEQGEALAGVVASGSVSDGESD